MGKKQANIRTSKKGFFKLWLDLTRPFHKLTDQEIEVVSLLLFYHNEFKEETTNVKMLWKFIFDYDTKQKIKKELGMKDQGLQNVLTSLRRKKVIINNSINPVYIPDLNKGDKDFKIIFNLIVNE